MLSRLVTGALVSLGAGAGVAFATPRALPFTYTTDTLAPGNVDVEQFADLVPLRARDTAGNGPFLYLASEYQSEIEVGIADRLELGLSVTLAPSRADDFTTTDVARLPEGNGLKQRLRYTLAEPGEWPVDVGVFGEVTETAREIGLGGRLLLQRRFGDLRIAANVTAEYGLYLDHTREVVFAPSAGATYEITPSFHAGLDGWSRGEYPQVTPTPVRTFGLGPQTYAGPAILYSFGKLWWSVGAYLRISDGSHEVAPGEVYGKVWFRSVIAYEL